ncbi:hypothetical protein BH11PSE3_BH11PSE3_22870 [soil metagenome]
MKHSVIVIPLSRQEEDTLRLIAHGACPASELRAGDLDQLLNLRLVEQKDGQASLTEFGEIRRAQIKELHLQAMIRAARSRANWRAA